MVLFLFFLIIFPVAEVNSLLNRYPGSGLLDIGANIGMYTLPIAKAGKKVCNLSFAEVLINVLIKARQRKLLWLTF